MEAGGWERGSSRGCFFKAQRGVLGSARGLLAFLLFSQLFQPQSFSPASPALSLRQQQQLLTCLSLKAVRGKKKKKKKEPSPKPTRPHQSRQKESPAAFLSLTCFSPKAAAVSSLPSPGSALNQQQEQPLPTRPRPEFRIPLSPTLHLVTSLTHKEGALRDVINACWERKQNSGLGSDSTNTQTHTQTLQFSKGKSIRDFFFPQSPDGEPVCGKRRVVFASVL